MTIYKKHKISQDLYKAFDALSHPLRYEIYITILEEACECDLDKKNEEYGNCVNSISKKLKVPQPTVSNHVKELINVGLIAPTRRGKNIYLFGTSMLANQIKDFGNFVLKEVKGHEH